MEATARAIPVDGSIAEHLDVNFFLSQVIIFSSLLAARVKVQKPLGKLKSDIIY